MSFEEMHNNKALESRSSFEPNTLDIGAPAELQLPGNAMVSSAMTSRYGPASEWDTTIANEQKPQAINSPAELYYIEPALPKAQDIYRHFLETQSKLGCLVDKNTSPTYKEVNGALEWVARRAGYESNEFELDIIRSPEPNAFIIHHEEISKPHIFITTALLEGLSEQYGRIRQGHIRFIFGHEIAHYKEGHYSQIRREEILPNSDPDPIKVRHIFGNLSFQSVRNYFFSLIFTRDQELRADELGIRWCAEQRKGEPEANPLEAVEVLDYLAEMKRRHDEEEPSEKSKSKNRYPLLSWAASQAMSTHPGSEGRAALGRGVYRQIEVEMSAKNPSSGVTARRWSKTPAIDCIVQDKEIQKTHLQEMFAELNKLITNKGLLKPISPEALSTFVSTRIAYYGVESRDYALQEIKHLMVFLPAFLRARERALPFEPYGGLKKEAPDKAEASLLHGLNTETAAALNDILSGLRDAAEGLLVGATSTTELSANDKLDLDLCAWLSCAGIYQTAWGSRLLYDNGIIERAKSAPAKFIELIAKHGEQFFDFRGISNEWIRPLLDSDKAEVRERGRWFARLVESEHVDLRAELFRLFLENGGLEKIESIDSLVTVIETAEREFGPEAFWSRGGMATLLGVEVEYWLDSKFDCGSPRENPDLNATFTRLKDRIRPHGSGVDYIVLEAAKIFLSGNDKRSALESKKNWIKGNFAPGQERDLAVCRLIEEESGLFQYNYKTYYLRDTREGKTPKHIQEIEELMPTKMAAKYIETVLSLLDLFDLSWFETSLARGDMASLERAEEEDELWGGKVSDRQKTREKLEYVLTDAPYHSGLLHNFVSTHYHQLMGPTTAEANIVRFYLRPFLDRYWGQATHGELKGAPAVNPREFYETLSKSNLFLVAAELPRTWSLRYAYNEKHWRSPAHKNWQNSADAHEFPENVVVEPARDHESRRNKADLGEDPLSSYERAAILNEAEFVGKYVERFSEFVQAVQNIPKGEFRDYVVLRELAYSLELQSLIRGQKKLEYVDTQIEESALRSLQAEKEQINRLTNSLQGKPPFHNAIFLRARALDAAKRLSNIKLLLGLLRGAGEEVASGAKIGTTASEQAFKMEIIRKVYDDYTLYLRFKAGAVISGVKLMPREVTIFNLQDVATEVGRMAFTQHFSIMKNFKLFQSLSPAEKLKEVSALFVFSSSERDAHLLRILREEEKSVAVIPSALSETSRRIYKLLYSPYHKAHLGERIYQASLAEDPAIHQDFERHFQLILDTHPASSVRREKRLKAFFDGALGREHCVARTWEHYDRICEVLAEEEKTTADESRLLRKGGVQFLEAALNELDISAKERVDTILWMVGLREKSHLVNCYEVVQGRSTAKLRDEVDKLTDEEKKHFIRTVLAGPHGILKTDDLRAKKEFLDTLFFSVFRRAEEGQKESVRYFKGVYDTMLRHIEPERAAQFLGNFLVAHLEGKNFNQQVKVFFESFGFVGVKTAQWLSSNTTMIPEDMKKVLLDLTSRVDGPDCRFVFELAPKIFGADARKIIKEIGDRVGGGSLMSFYEVTLHDGRQGVVGVLRPDIMYALPEDILLVHRVIETMQEAPEVFGGKTIPGDLMENLVWMSLVETNLGRTARLQQIMKRQIEDQRHKMPVRVPAIWTTAEVEDDDGSRRTVKLNQGPFIFMEMAKGKTLDLFIDSCQKQGESGREKIREVKNRIIEVFLDQISKHGLVHCDLHPGNILVSEEDGRIEVTVLDIGLSTELGKNTTSILQRYLRIGIGNTNFSDDHPSLERALKKFMGLGEVSEEKAKRWIEWTVDVIESELGKCWDDDLKKRAVDVVMKVTQDRKTSVPNKLSQIMELTREVGLSFPRELYYILRAVSVMDYVWEDVDWKRQSTKLQQFVKEEKEVEPLPDIDIELICGKVDLCAQHLELGLDIMRVRDILRSANAEQSLERRITVVRDGMFEILNELGKDGQKLLQTLLQDQELRIELGLAQLAEKAQAFFDLQEAERNKSAKDEFGFLAVNALPKGMPRELAYIHEFGSLVPVWRLNFYPGSMVRTTNSQGKVVDRYVVLGHNSLYDPVGKIELGRFLSWDLAVDMEDLAIGIFAERDMIEAKDIKSEWKQSVFAMREHIRHYKDETTHKEDPKQGRNRDRGGEEDFGLKSADEDDGKPMPYTNYLKFIGSLTNRELTMDTLTLGELISSARGPIEVMVNGKWRRLDQCMYEKGETSAQWQAHMQETRRRLGLPKVRGI